MMGHIMGENMDKKIKSNDFGREMINYCGYSLNRYIYIPNAIIIYHMIQNYSRYRVLRAFCDFPNRNFQFRELSRLTKLTQPALLNHLKELIKENLILREEKGIYPSYKANRDNVLFKFYKKYDIILRIHQIKLIDYIYDSCLPNAIILFGSAAKGEDTEESDIDIFIQSKEKKLNLEKYEKYLNRKVSLYFQEDITKIPNELKNNILNGTVLKGYVKVF